MDASSCSQHPFAPLLASLQAMSGRHHGMPPFGPFARGFERWASGGSSGSGHRAQRGDVRAALLSLLAEEPRNGYKLMQEIERRSLGEWKPSPGSIYPALQQLEDEGLVRTEERDGGRVFVLTDAGRDQLKAQEPAPPPWERAAAGAQGQTTETGALFELARLAATALVQVVRTGTPAQHDAAADVLRDTRRRLYAILAQDED